MKKKYLTSGAESMPTHELLEILLFYCIPQRDTNELAHQMLERFGSLDACFLRCDWFPAVIF